MRATTALLCLCAGSAAALPTVFNQETCVCELTDPSWEGAPPASCINRAAEISRWRSMTFHQPQLADMMAGDEDDPVHAREWSRCSLHKIWRDVTSSVRKLILPLEATEEMSALQQAHLTKRDALKHDITGKPLMKHPHRHHRFPPKMQGYVPRPAERRPAKWKVVCYAQAEPDFTHTVQAFLLAISPFVLIFALVASLSDHFEDEPERILLRYEDDGGSWDFKQPLDPIQESDDER